MKDWEDVFCRFRDETEPAPAKRQKCGTKAVQNDGASSSHGNARQSFSTLHRGAVKKQEPLLPCSSRVRKSSTDVNARPGSAASQSGARKPSRQSPSCSSTSDMSLSSDKDMGPDETLMPASVSTVVGSKPRVRGVSQTRSTAPVGGEVDFASTLRRDDELSVS